MDNWVFDVVLFMAVLLLLIWNADISDYADFIDSET